MCSCNCLINFRHEVFNYNVLGIGNPEPKTIPIFDGLTENTGYYTSKSFLPQVCVLGRKIYK